MKHKFKRLLSLLLSLTMLTAALPAPVWAEETGFAQATDAEAELPDEPEETIKPELPIEPPEATAEPELPIEPTDALLETETPENTAEPTPQVTEEPLPTPEPEAAYQAGMFVLVTESTRAFSDVDETADADYGELYDGNFVRTANVRVEEVRQDGMGRTWLLACYLYGEEEPDGEMAWTDMAMVWVLAEETQPSDAADYDVTAYAFPFTPVELYAADTPPRLQTLSGNTGEFYAGQTVYAYSVHDDVQIASLKNYGAIYATQHYINEHVVYCLEHTMNSPGIKNNPEGPYKVVDLAQYGQTAGYSGIIYSEKTMHAIGWVLRHTFPYMGLDRYEDECLEWSRAAGQFAIREVIKQLEGAQYVRDYWHMDEFYRATRQAPKEYLEYARWLAANARTYAQMTGEITVSNVSVSVANGVCTGTATLTTDAPRIRIRRSVGTITGYTGGEDSTYVYLNSGDTITVSQAGSGFSFTAESVSTEDQESNFLVAVPDADIQKVVIPQRGSPYPLKSTEIRFDMPNGALIVTKTDAANGAALAGATFELTNASGAVVATQTTGADGTARFDNLPAGNYTVREVGAPTGYLVAVPDSQSVTVTAGGTAGAAFADERIRGKIRIAKTDSLTKAPLAGAEFTITRTDGTGAPIVLTTDANGYAETDWLDYGRYRVTESKVPAHYETNGFSTEIDCTENGKTYFVEVENEPTKGFIQIVKTDTLDGRPIEDVQFDIVDAGGNIVGTMTTDANGAATSPALPKGQYILFTDFLLKWLRVAKSTVKLTTYASYEMMATRIIIPYFETLNIKLKELTTEDIQEFYSAQLERVSANTVIHYHAVIHRALKYAVKIKTIQANPAANVERPKKEKFIGGFYDKKEVNVLFDIVQGNPLEVAIKLAAFYGLRREEIIGLKWNAIDFENSTLTIQHTVTECNLNGKHIEVASDTVKTDSRLRTMPLVADFQEMLLAKKEKQEHYRKLCGKSYCKQYLDFMQRKKSPMTSMRLFSMAES